MKVVQVRGLTKDYRQHFWQSSTRVLHGVHFDVEQGEIFGFLGPNGSGKSTTIKILLEIIFPTSGDAKIFGYPAGSIEAKRRLGFLPENPYFYDYLTGFQFLTFHGRLWGLDSSYLNRRIPEVLELTGMQGTENRPLRHFSKGMLQRIGLAQAILPNPELVILDEPMTGLDPVGRKEVRDLMLELKRQGKTVFFSTHILSDVETVCDRVAILNKGHLLSCGSLDELVSVESKYADIVWSTSYTQLKPWLDAEGLEASDQGGSVYVKFLPKPNESQNEFVSRLNSSIQRGLGMGGILHSVTHHQDSLEDVFVKQVGHLESRV